MATIPSSPVSALINVVTAPLQRRMTGLIYPAGTRPADFLEPAGEPALTAQDSVSWRVFRNPVPVFVGGVTAVLLELAEPRVRSGVWEHTTFRTHPLERMQRTGHATMMTVYGARSRAEALIAKVRVAHARVEGRTPAGTPYRANDVELLTWVHATASFGFVEAYGACVEPLSQLDRDRFYREGQPSARLFGVELPPGSERDVENLFERMRPQLQASQIVMDFLRIVQEMPVLPRLFRPVQAVLIKAAVQCLPAWTRDRLHLDGAEWRVPNWQWTLLRQAGLQAGRMTLADLPAALAGRRMAA